MIAGKIFFRDVQGTKIGKRQFILVGQLWIPQDVSIKGEHVYQVIGSQFSNEGIESVGLQILLQSGEDVTNETRKKHPSQIVPLTATLSS